MTFDETMTDFFLINTQLSSHTKKILSNS